MNLTEVLNLGEEGIYTAVGAGGKTSLLSTLGWEWRKSGRCFVLTTTTKMFYWQVRDFSPVLIKDFDRGLGYVEKRIKDRGYAGWFSKWREGKVDGLPPDWVDELYIRKIVTSVLVEGDGARRCLLKAPNNHEPVVPSQTKTVLGVLNLQAIGRELLPGVVHRADLAADLLHKPVGARIEDRDLAEMALNSRGIFRGSAGQRILVLTGGDSGNKAAAREIARLLKLKDPRRIMRCVLTSGYGSKMRPVEVYDLY